MDFSCEWNKCNLKNFKLYLKELADDNYRNFHSKIVPNINYFYGVQIPKLRKIAKEISKYNKFAFLNVASKENAYEFNMLEGLIIANLKDFNTFNLYFKSFLKRITNWCVCDIFVGEAKIIAQYKKFYFPEFLKLIKTEETYNIRVALVAFLKFFKQKEYLKDIINFLTNIKNDDYYVKMAQAWLLQEFSCEFPEEIRNVINNDLVDCDIRKMTIQKIRDSKRNSLEYKNSFK